MLRQKWKDGTSGAVQQVSVNFIGMKHFRFEFQLLYTRSSRNILGKLGAL